MIDVIILLILGLFITDMILYLFTNKRKWYHWIPLGKIIHIIIILFKRNH